MNQVRDEAPRGARESAVDEIGTIADRPSPRQLALATGVLLGSVAAALMAGLGVGIFVASIATVVSALWISYGSSATSASISDATAGTEQLEVPARQGATGHRWSLDVDRASIQERLSIRRRVQYTALLGSFLLIAAGAWLYFAKRSQNPPGFFADEAEIGIQAWRLLRGDAATTSIPFFYHHLEYDHLGTLTLFSTAPFVGMLGLNESSVRGAEGFWMIAAAIVIYFTLRALRIPYAAIAVLVMMTLPIVILVGRVNFGHAASLMAMSCGYALWVASRRRESWRWPLAAGVGIALSAYGQSSYYIAAPLLLGAIAFTEIAFHRSDWAKYRQVGWLLLGSGITFVPVVYRALTYEPFLQRFDEKSAGSSRGLGRVEAWIREYPSYLRFDLLFGETGGGWLTRHYIPGAPLVFSWVSILLAIGFAGLLLVRRDSVQRYVWPMALVLLLFPVPDIVSTGPNDEPYSYSLVWAVVGIPFVVGYGFRCVQALAERYRVTRLASAYGATVALVTVLSVASFWRGPFDRYPSVAADYWGWQFGPRQAIDYFGAHGAEYDEFYLSGDFNAAYILTEFYRHGTDIEPKVHTGGLEFVDLDRRQLFAVRLDEWYRYAGSQYPARSYVEILDTIAYPNGQPAMLIVRTAPALVQPATGPERDARG